MSKKRRITETLRRAIVEAEESRYSIAKKTGILQSTLCRFVQGTEAVGPTLDRLADYFNLELQPVKQNRKRKGK